MDWNELIRPEIDPMVPYAPGLRASEVRERLGGGEVHKLSSNENPYGPVPSAVAAMTAVLPYLNRYCDGSSRALRRRLSEHLGVSDEYIVIGNGSNELLRIIAQCVLRPGDECVFAAPSFVVYGIVTQLMGATAVKVPVDAQQRHDLDAMLAAVTERTRLLFLCNPNNPTGTYYGREEFESFLERVPGHVLVVVDEAYFEYATAADFPDALRYFDSERPLVTLRTFSKIYSLAGVRVGYGVMPVALAEAVAKIREPFNVNTVAQIGAYHSLDAGDEITRRRDECAAQRESLYRAFDRLGVRYSPSQTNFIWIHTERPQELFEALLAQGVIVRGFGPVPALRVGVGSPEDTAATIAAFEASAHLI